jgi:hypothetical protein
MHRRGDDPRPLGRLPAPAVPLAAERRERSRSAPSRRTRRRAAVLATIGFAVIAIFQLVLAAGAPLGHAAWGGADADLTTGQRIGSGSAVVLWTAAALIVLGRAGFWGQGKATPLRWGTWFFAAVTGISALPQFASESRWENFIWGPLALILAALCTMVALSPPTTDS